MQASQIFPTPRIFQEAEIRALLDYAALIPEMARALMDFSSGAAQQPARTILRMERENGWFACMPGVYKDVMGAKLVTFYPENKARDLPTHMATIQILDPKTGQPLAILDGRLITEMRTAAVSAVAVETLAQKDVRILAILGSSIQASAHLEALQRVRKFEEVRGASRMVERACAFADEANGKYGSALQVHATTAEEALWGADVVVTATSSPTPVLRGAWLKDDALVIAVGAVAHDRRELDDEAMQATVIVDSREAAMREAGDVLLSGASIHAELGEVLSEKKKCISDGVTVFKSLGLAVEDLAAARLVYRAATMAG